MTKSHIYTSLDWPNVICGESESARRRGAYRSTTKGLEHIKDICPECLEKLPLHQLAATDLGDEDPQIPAFNTLEEYDKLASYGKNK